MRSKWFWAVLALVAVLGITAAASATTRGLITGKMIAPHSINSKHFVNHTIKAHDLSHALINSLQNERLVAQRDAVQSGVFLNLSNTPVINTVTLTAPSSGVVTIIGQAYVNNEGVAGEYRLIPRLDGASVSGPVWVALHDTTAGEEFTLNFAISTTVSAGTHTITDAIYGPATHGYVNANNLNVLFAPSGSVASAPSAPASASASATGGR